MGMVPSRHQALLCHLDCCHAPLGAQTAAQYLWLANVAVKCPQGELTIQCKCTYRQLSTGMSLEETVIFIYDLAT